MDNITAIDPSFVLNWDQVNGLGYTPATGVAVQTGSSLGVPPVQSIAGETPDQYAGSGGNAQAYGSKTATQSPAHQPIFWLVVLMALAVVMLSHIAHLSLK